MSSIIQEAMSAAIAQRIMPQEDSEIKLAVSMDIKSEAQIRSIDRKSELTAKISRLKREEQLQDKPDADVIEAYQARLEELKKVS